MKNLKIGHAYKTDLIKRPDFKTTFLSFYDLDQTSLLSSRVNSSRVDSAIVLNSARNRLTEKKMKQNENANEKIETETNQKSSLQADSQSDMKSMNESTVKNKRIIRSAPARNRFLFTKNSVFLSPNPNSIFINTQKISPAAEQPFKGRPQTSRTVPGISRKSGRVGIKAQAKSYSNFESLKMDNLRQIDQYHMPPMDREYQSFSNKKKQINEQLHEHWKQDLSAAEKGKIRKLPEGMTQNDNEEWITIQKPPTDPDQSDEPKDLIDTFTSNIYDDNTSTYKVTSTVGTLIANKIFNGEKIRVGVNGQFLKDGTEDMKNATFKKLIETETVYDPASVLSWKQQVGKDDIKVVEPTFLQNSKFKKEDRKDRNLVVKKLIDEEEFLPCYAKKSNQQFHEDTTSSLSGFSYAEDLRMKKQFSAPKDTYPAMEPRIRQYNIPVQVVGTNTIGHPFQQHCQTQKSIDEAKTPKKQVQTSNTKRVDFKKPQTVGKQRPVITLNEKNYIQLVDNLTQKYTEASQAARLKQEADLQSQQELGSLFGQINSDKVKIYKANTNNNPPAPHTELESLDFINDLGLSGVDEYVASKGQNWQTSKVSGRLRNESLSASSKKIHQNLNDKNKRINLNLNTEPNNESTKLHLNTSFSDHTGEVPLESDCVITIKSFVSSEKENFIPDTPQSYSSYTACPRCPKGQLFPNRKPKTSNFVTRPGNRGKISSLGGGFYFNTNKQSIPSAYYTYNREGSAARSANTSRPKQRQALTADILNNSQGTETKYFNISKPLIAPRPSHAFHSHSHYYHRIF